MLTAPCLIRRCVATDSMPASGLSSFDKRLCMPRGAGCEWLYVDFDDDLAPFYVKACGFEPTQAGLDPVAGSGIPGW